MLTAIGASTQASCPAAGKDTGFLDMDRENATLDIHSSRSLASARDSGSREPRRVSTLFGNLSRRQKRVLLVEFAHRTAALELLLAVKTKGGPGNSIQPFFGDHLLAVQADAKTASLDAL